VCTRSVSRWEGKRIKSKIEMELCVWGVERQAKLSFCNCRADEKNKKENNLSAVR
jgi:hypothetical protein